MTFQAPTIPMPAYLKERKSAPAKVAYPRIEFRVYGSEGRFHYEPYESFFPVSAISTQKAASAFAYTLDAHEEADGTAVHVKAILAFDAAGADDVDVSACLMLLARVHHAAQFTWRRDADALRTASRLYTR
jgi:hypothetical protein